MNSGHHALLFPIVLDVAMRLSLRNSNTFREGRSESIRDSGGQWTLLDSVVSQRLSPTGLTASPRCTCSMLHVSTGRFETSPTQHKRAPLLTCVGKPEKARPSTHRWTYL
jgi:hypothetical protein